MDLNGESRVPGLHLSYLDRQITLFAPIDRAVRQWRSRKEMVNKYHQVQSCVFPITNLYLHFPLQPNIKYEILSYMCNLGDILST